MKPPPVPPVKDRLRIGVMGPAACSDPILDLASEVGRRIALAGAILICGGRTGVMEAAARGAREAGGLTVGILPGAQPAEANPFIDLPVITDLGNARNVVNVLTSHVVIAIHGGYGTLSEIALALKVGTPVVGLRTWELTPPPGGELAGFYEADTPEQAVRLALELAARPER